MNDLRKVGDVLKEKLDSGVIILASDKGGKVNFIATATKCPSKEYIVVI